MVVFGSVSHRCVEQKTRTLEVVVMADPKMSEGTEMLMEHLLYGERNAKTQEDLAVEMGITPLAVRRLVHAARCLDKIVICNYRDGYGYFLPENNDEVLAQYRKTYRRGKAVFAQLNALLKAMQMGGQMTIEDIIAETEAL